jgi:alcohol dehydrogenase
LQIDCASTFDPTANEAAGADLVFELSGQPNALNAAINACGYGGRLIVGSWYGTKPADIDLGGRFHRQHISIRSSQVSTIGPEHRARWSKRRRMSVARDYCQRLHPATKWSVKYNINNAADVYKRLADGQVDSPNVLFTYPSE